MRRNYRRKKLRENGASNNLFISLVCLNINGMDVKTLINLKKLLIILFFSILLHICNPSTEFPNLQHGSNITQVVHSGSKHSDSQHGENVSNSQLNAPQVKHVFIQQININNSGIMNMAIGSNIQTMTINGTVKEHITDSVLLADSSRKAH